MVDTFKKLKWMIHLRFLKEAELISDSIWSQIRAYSEIESYEF
jgi:hypothetical protein